jgi:osmoprotectant transport system permease protein
MSGDNVLRQALIWLNDPLNWQGPHGVPALTVEHLGMSGAAVLIAAVIALPWGVWLGHRPRGGTLTVFASNTSRALPTLALLFIFATTGLGFGNRPTVVAASRVAGGMGMSSGRVLRTVELPLAVPLIAAGLRTAAVQVVATVPLAALVGGGGLGTIIVTGFATQQYGQVVAGAFLVAALCLAIEGLLALAQRAVTPPPLRVAAAVGR